MSKSFLFLFFYVIVKTVVRSQCYIQDSLDSTLCKTCTYSNNFNFSDSWIGPEGLFNVSECKFMLNRSSLTLFISPNPCKNVSSCNGSISDPFDSLIKAFKRGWRSSASVLNFYLMSDEAENESCKHFINKVDYTSQLFYVFRRFYADISISPLYCSFMNVSGCLRNGNLKAKILIRTQTIFFFVAKNFFLVDVILDGSDLIMDAKNLINSSNLRTELCSNEDLLSEGGPCSLKGMNSSEIPNSFGLFNVEVPIDCSSCTSSIIQEKLKLERVEIKNFYYYGDGLGFASLITVQTLRFYVQIKESLIHWSFFPKGIIISIEMPDLYALKESEYIKAKENNKERVFIVESSMVRDYNHFQISPNKNENPPCLFICFSQISFDLYLNFSSFINNNLPATEDSSSYFIYTAIPILDEKLKVNITINNCEFIDIQTDYLLVFRKYTEGNYKILINIITNLFSRTSNCCFEFIFGNCIFMGNTFNFLKFSSLVTFIDITNGILNFTNNEFSRIEFNPTGTLFYFRGKQYKTDSEIFSNSSMTKFHYYTACSIIGNIFYDFSAEFIIIESIVWYIFFNDNIIEKLSIPASDMFRGKVETILKITNNTFRQISVNLFFGFNIFKNFTLINNTFIGLDSELMMNSMLLSITEPYSYIIVEQNNFMEVFFMIDGFTISPFSEKTGIIFSIKNNCVEGLTGSSEGALFPLFFSEIEFHGNKFKAISNTSVLKSYALSTGQLYCSIVRCLIESLDQMQHALFVDRFFLLEIEDCKFSGGGIMSPRPAMNYFSSMNGMIIMSLCTFENVSSLITGALMIKLQAIKNINIINCTFSSNSGYMLAADIFLQITEKDPDFVTLWSSFIPKSFGLINNIFNNSKGGLGGSIQISDNSQVIMINNTFINSQANKGGAVYISKKSELIVKGGFFFSGVALSYGGFIYLFNAFILLSDVDMYYSVADFGGALCAEESSLIINYGQIENASAGIGGAIYSSFSQLNLFYIKTNFTHALYNGGSICLLKGSSTMRNVEIKNSKSEFDAGGAIFADTLENLKIRNLLLSFCETLADGIIFIRSSKIGRCLLSKILCTNNKARGDGDCLFLKEGSCSFEDLNIMKNTVGRCALCFRFISSQVKAVVTFSNISIANNYFGESTFSIKGPGLLQIKNLSFQTSTTGKDFIFMNILETEVFLENIYFDALSEGKRYLACESSVIRALHMKLHLEGKIGGIWATKNSFITLNTISIYRANRISLQDSYGGSIYIYDSILSLLNSNVTNSSATIGNILYGIGSNINLVDCIFSGKNSNKYPINIYLSGSVVNEKTISNFSMSYIVFLGIAGIRIKFQSSCNINKVIFSLTETFPNANGCFIEESALTVINSSLFRGFWTESMSALNLIGSILKMKIIMNFVEFDSCNSDSAGAGLRIEGFIGGDVSACTFKNNTSQESGGAVFMSLSSEESILLIEKCLFISNRARKYGNSIKINYFLPIFAFNTTGISSYAANFRMIYGKKINQEDLRATIKNLGAEALSDYFVTELSRVASGQNIELYLIVFDHYDNILNIEETGTFTVFDSGSNQSIIFKNSIMAANDGLAITNNLLIIAEPGESYNVTIRYTNNITKREFTKEVSVHMRRCQKGEIYIDKVCLVCPERFYSLVYEPNKDESLTCQPCKPNSICPGGSIILPQEGYWRMDENQTLVLKCKVMDACPAISVDNKYDLDSFKYQPVCGANYRGNICFGCINLYGKVDTEECIKCSMSPWFVIKYISLVLISILLSVYQIWSAFSVDVIYSKRRCLIKLLVDHFTYIGLLSRFNIDWAATIQIFLGINDSYISMTPAEMFNFDCYLSLYLNHSQKFFVNSILISLSPIFYGLINIIILYCARLTLILGQKILSLRAEKKVSQTPNIKRQKSQESNDQNNSGTKFLPNLIATLLIIIYNYYPRILMNAIGWLRCIEIDDSGTLVLENEPDIFCWTDNHIKYVLIIAIPTLVIWCLSAPLLIFYLTIRVKGIMRSSKNEIWKQLMDFISIDYKDAYYFWDFFTYIFKFSVVFCAMISNGLEPASQGSFLIFITLIIFLIQEKVRPFKYHFINNMFTASYIVRICTSAFAIMASAKGMTEIQRLIYILTLFIINAVFYLVWFYYFFKEAADWLFLMEFLRKHWSKLSLFQSGSTDNGQKKQG